MVPAPELKVATVPWTEPPVAGRGKGRVSVEATPTSSANSLLQIIIITS